MVLYCKSDDKALLCAIGGWEVLDERVALGRTGQEA